MRVQHCDSCGFRIKHGYPFRRALLCSQACLSAYGREIASRKKAKP